MARNTLVFAWLALLVVDKSGTLCDSTRPTTRPTTAHILGGCPVVLTQQRYTYCHDQVLHLLASKLKEMFSDNPSIHVFADLQGL